MLSRIFIDRPILAWVVSIIIMVSGLGGLLTLPLEQYPDIAPPNINVYASYPGAAAEALEASVTQVIEQQLTGIDGLLYISSSSSSAQGLASITVTLEKGTDPDIAQIQIQNKVQQAIPRLPKTVQEQGVRVAKSSPDFFLFLSLFDATDHSTTADLADYLVSNLMDPINRLPGVGDVRLYGSEYAMRIWLDPHKLSSYGLVPADVRNAVQAQNTQIAAGLIGAQPAPPGQALVAMASARSSFETPEQFRNIILKRQSDGSKVLLGDVARVEIGSEGYGSDTRVNGHPGAGLAVQLAPGADALKTAELVKAVVAERAKSFPAGYRHAYSRDGTQFIRRSIEQVGKTLLEAIVLVVLVMFGFMRNLRATLIPAVAVPIVLLGTFGVLAALGFSANTLTLFGLVLAIGLLVDDAIVVVENVERLMRENPGMDARRATIQSMREIQTALVAIALVLSAVFLPLAFFKGTTGAIYRQFSVTIISTMALSVGVALVLTPALTASLMTGVSHPPRRLIAPARGRRLLKSIDRAIHRASEANQRAISAVIARPALSTLVYLALAALLAILVIRLPKGFLPTEDEGAVTVQFYLPPGASQQRAMAIAEQVEKYVLDREKQTVEVLSLVTGLGGANQNLGVGFLSLVPWQDRPEEENSAQQLAQRASRELSNIWDARVVAFTPPPVRGLGLANGFTLQLLNNSNLTREEFENRRDRLLLEASRAPELTAVRATAVNDAPALRIDIDQMKVSALGVAPQDVYQTLTAAWAGAYINDFVDRGRAKRVHMQGDAPYRSAPSDLDAWSVRSADGQMVSFAAFSTTSWSTAPTAVSRFAGLPSHEIQGQAAPGRSSGEAMSRIAALADEIPGVSVAWSGLSYQERTSSGQTTSLYVLSLVVVFLCLAALYESWSIPFAVLLVVPLGVLGAVLAGTLRGLQNDIFFQIGLVTTMGLAAKNAILIVEFADRAHKGGKSAVQAALDASRLRLRPIIMTSAAFSAGVLPLAVAVGAGARSRIAIGTTVLGGVLASTLLTILYVPAFFVLLRRLSSGVASVGARTPPGDPAGPGTVGRGRAPRPSLPTSD